MQPRPAFTLLSVFSIPLLVLACLGGLLAPAFTIPALILCALAGMGIAGLFMWRNQEFTTMESRLREAEGNAARQGKALTDSSSFMEKTLLLQEELSSQIGKTIVEAAQVSKDAQVSARRIEGFNHDFQEASTAFQAMDNATEQLRIGVFSTSSATEQTSASVEAISDSINRISTESEQRYQEIHTLSNLTRQGQAEMLKTLEVFKELSGNLDSLNQFIDMINDIASRTSLLAMNAAIQAAHAGEAGRGFAVVADEVRKLAESSAQNADIISKRLKSLVDDIGRARDASSRTAGILSETEKKVDAAGNSFLQIQQGTRELSLGGKEILEAIMSLRDVATSVKATATDLAETGTSLRTRLWHLRTESGNIMSDMQLVQTTAASINFNSLSMAQASMKALSMARSTAELASNSSDSRDKPQLLGATQSLVTIETAHLVALLRAVLDGKAQANERTLFEHAHTLESWFESEEGKKHPEPQRVSELKSAWYAASAQAKEILALCAQRQTPAAEAAFVHYSAAMSQLSRQATTLVGSNKGGASAAFMTWSDQLSMGNNAMDAQHRELVRLVNQLALAIRQGQGSTTLGPVLDKLVQYTVHHFEDEEKLFMSSSYPDKEKHLAQHRALTGQVGELQKNYRAGTAVLGTDTLIFLRDWLVNHILGTDKGYCSYIPRDKA